MRRPGPKAGNSEAGQGRAEGLILSPAFAARLYSSLKKEFGFRHWWPADTPFEVAVGAILTQQTTWTNVEKAIVNLRAAKALSLDGICGLNISELERLIRPSGYFRQKATRLKGFCLFVRDAHGSLETLAAMDDKKLRELLLSINGIGKETCDSIMLYALGKRIFVIDAYTKRIVSRMLGIGRELEYDELQGAFHSSMRRDAGLYKDMHAQLVELAKRNCTKREPRCAKCPVLDMCRHGGSAVYTFTGTPSKPVNRMKGKA